MFMDFMDFNLLADVLLVEVVVVVNADTNKRARPLPRIILLLILSFEETASKREVARRKRMDDFLFFFFFNNTLCA